jgi:hypothetical protein
MYVSWLIQSKIVVFTTVINIHAPLPGVKRWITFVKILYNSVTLVCSLQGRELWFRLQIGSIISDRRCAGRLRDVHNVPSSRT